MVARVTLEIALDREFDYSIPPEFAGTLEAGSRVKVPFGPRQVMGVVTALVEHSEHGRLRPISRVLDERSILTPQVLALARWMAQYYCCPVEIALKSVLPQAVRKEQAGWRERLHVHAVPGVEPAAGLSKRQLEVLERIGEAGEVPLQALLQASQTTMQTLRRLETQGLIEIAPKLMERDPYAGDEIVPSGPLQVNPEQAAALSAIEAAMGEIAGVESQAGASPGSGINTAPGEQVRGPGRHSHTFLLHGVTGSGKTEVYLQAIAHALEGGHGAIVLVPEISLTPQTVERFKARFHSGPQKTLVAVLHSQLSAGERHDEWHKIRQGRARIVIGARSAVFAPVERLGLIIVDEEHENSYKQEEAPRYHARDLAVVRGQMAGAVVVLGSATPSLESYHNVKRGKYRLLELTARVDDKRMPVVRVVDLRKENRKHPGVQILSQVLKEAIQRRLEEREQVILFLNRRGYATSMQCPRCGFVAQCPNCSVSLTYHRREQRLTCHICGHQQGAPRICPEPKCANPAIRFAGLGTERVEDTLVKLFPHARIQRMDSDTLQRKDDYRRILSLFRTGRIDILVGTQMIAKGLHFPNVTLVGIIYADLSLHQPDFRAGERTFQLLTQVAGRAGRGDVEGEVIVQAFTPSHPAIQFARQHDFTGFFEAEIEFRKQLSYPPFSRVALLTVRGANELKVRLSADHLRAELNQRMAGMKNLVITGPAPAPLARAETFYRYQVMLRTGTMSRVGQVLNEMGRQIALPDDVHWTTDIDPVNLV